MAKINNKNLAVGTALGGVAGASASIANDLTGGSQEKKKKTQSKASRFTNQAYREARKVARPTQIRTNQLYSQAQTGLGQLAPEQQKLQQSQMSNVLAKQGLVQDLQSVLRGDKESLAEAQLKTSTDRNLAQQLAMTNRARGGNIALAMRGQQQAVAQSGRDINAQAALLRLQEQQQAREQLGGLTGQSEQLLTSTQGQREALLRQQADNAAQLRLQADLGKQAAMSQAAQNVSALKLGTTQADIAQQAQSNQLAGALIGAGGTAAAGYLSRTPPAAAPASDVNMKKDIKSESNPSSNSKFDSKDFLSKISANSYKYKNPNLPETKEGEQFSPMAQDLEKAGSIGKAMVSNGPNGKTVDYQRGFGAILAAQVQLNKRLEELESKKNKKS